jgi:hypothetical protein
MNLDHQIAQNEWWLHWRGAFLVPSADPRSLVKSLCRVWAPATGQALASATTAHCCALVRLYLFGHLAEGELPPGLKTYKLTRGWNPIIV